MKSECFKHIKKRIEDEIDQVTKKHPDFGEVLYDKLSNFFEKNFTGIGILTFSKNHSHNSVYEKVFVDDDTVLFRRTRDFFCKE